MKPHVARQTARAPAPAPAPAPPQPGYTIEKWDRSWRLLDPQGELVCLTVYKKGAQEVIRRLQAAV